MSFDRWFPHAILLAVAAVWLAIASGCAPWRGQLDQNCHPDGTCNSPNLECAEYSFGHLCRVKVKK